ncbi:MAG: HAD family hydrolase [Selenomonas sp.]
MKPYEQYMLISDLDGTIVPHGKAISAANAEAIRAFVAGGGLFGIATGRTPEAAGGYVRGLPITAPSIFFNGSMLYDWQERKVLARRPLQGAEDSPHIWPRFAAECLKMFPQACVEV